jgi:hypothetical protein
MVVASGIVFFVRAGAARAARPPANQEMCE